MEGRRRRDGERGQRKRRRETQDARKRRDGQVRSTTKLEQDIHTIQKSQ